MNYFVRHCAVLLLALQLSSSLERGHICIDHRISSEKTGFCKLPTECPSAVSNIPRGIFPLTCGFEGNIPIVCCYENDNNAPTTSRSPTTVTSKRNTRETISAAKCKEYSLYVYSNESAPVLLPGIHLVTIDKCGAVSGSELIVSSNIAYPREFPHMALIGYKSPNGKIWQCGGALISEQYILTSATCTFSQTYGYVRYVRLGDLDLSQSRDIAEPQDINVLEIMKHPDYDSSSISNDIALLKLERPATLNTFVRPACLPTKKTIEFTRLLAGGWGTLSPNSAINPQMQRDILDIVDTSRCVEKLRRSGDYNINISGDELFCAEAQNTQACVADRGGPAQIHDSDVYCSYTVVGVTTFWRRCGIENLPVVYTRVSKYIDWVEKNIWS